MSLSLNCYVPVEVLETDKISVLKDLIKQKKASRLKDVDASDLDIWKVDLNLDNFEEEFKNFKPDPHLKLRPQKRLSTFKDGIDDHLHVVVKAPGTLQQSSLKGFRSDPDSSSS